MAIGLAVSCSVVSSSWKGLPSKKLTRLTGNAGNFADKGCSNNKRARLISCQQSNERKGSSTKIVINGAGGEMGRAAIIAVSSARGLTLGGAVDGDFSLSGLDAGELAGIEPLEIPVTRDLVMVLASIANARDTGVLVDLDGGEDAYENIRQAAAFGLKSVVLSDSIPMDKVESLKEFCDKASAGCILAPSLDIGGALLQQSALNTAYHYSSVDILETLQGGRPSAAAIQLAGALSDLGKEFKPSSEVEAEGGYELLGEDGVHWKGLEAGSNGRRIEVRFSAPGQVFSLSHDYDGVQSALPGLLLAVRRVLRLRTLVYGIERVI